jgi:hypothetical protein
MYHLSSQSFLFSNMFLIQVLTNFISIGLENVHRIGTMTEVEVEEAIETAGLERELLIEISIEEKADASLVVVKDILQETAVEIEEEMTPEIEAEIDLKNQEESKE